MAHTRDVHNGLDIIDSRDVIARISELEGDVEAQREDTDTYPDGPDEDLVAELAALKALENEADGCADWIHGETLIRDSYFEQYAQELAEDCGMVTKDNQWPNRCIDWEQAAAELQMDYTSVEFDGVTYWIRS